MKSSLRTLPHVGTWAMAISNTNLSAITLGAALPVQTTLSGVSASVSVNRTTTSPLYFVSFGQINAVLPSATPVGTGTITVTNSGGTSAPFPITVVKSAFGLLTTNYGSGPAQGFDASIDASNRYILFDFMQVTNPGDILELWGTGLGPVVDDVTGGHVSNTVDVYIGGIHVKPMYAGPSGYTAWIKPTCRFPQGFPAAMLRWWSRRAIS